MMGMEVDLKGEGKEKRAGRRRVPGASGKGQNDYIFTSITRSIVRLRGGMRDVQVFCFDTCSVQMIAMKEQMKRYAEKEQLAPSQARLPQFYAYFGLLGCLSRAGVGEMNFEAAEEQFQGLASFAGSRSRSVSGPTTWPGSRWRETLYCFVQQRKK